MGIVERLREAAEAQEKATKGPWYAMVGLVHVRTARGQEDSIGFIAECSNRKSPRGPHEEVRNGMFIAKARSIPITALADLVEAVKLRKALQSNLSQTIMRGSCRDIEDAILDAENREDKALAALEESNGNTP
jgi:hypothetical protein